MLSEPRERLKELGKKFHIGDVLSVTTGRMVSPNHMGGIYGILNYMTGDNLFTHALPRASEECKPHIFALYPELKNVDSESFTKENWEEWLTKQALTYGEWLEIEPILNHIHKDPIEELADMMGGG